MSSKRQKTGLLSNVTALVKFLFILPHVSFFIVYIVRVIKLLVYPKYSLSILPLIIELLTEELEKGFLKVLSHLKKKDPKLYTDNLTFFHNEDNVSKKAVKAEEKQKEITQWLKGQKVSVEVEEKEELNALHDFWSNPNLDEKEQFLRDYLLDKTFLKPDDKFDPSKEIEKLDEEEREVEEQLEFEEKFNYRYENCDEEFLKNYPRTMEKSCGRKNDTSEKKRSNAEDSTLEHEQATQNHKYKTKESSESSNEPDDGFVSYEKEDAITHKIQEDTGKRFIEQPKILKRIMKTNHKTNCFVVTSSETQPVEAKGKKKQKKPRYKTRFQIAMGNVKESDLQSSKKMLKSHANYMETKNRYEKEKSKLVKLSNDIEYLKKLLSQKQNKQVTTGFRVNKKLNNFLAMKMKKKLISEKKLALPSQQHMGEILRKRKQKHRAKRRLCQMPEIFYENPSSTGKFIRKSFETRKIKRKEKHNGQLSAKSKS